MTSLYLIVVAAVVCACPSDGHKLYISPANTGITNTGFLTHDLSTVTTGIVCGGDPAVKFTVDSSVADGHLNKGDRVWKISFLPLKIGQLVREAKTTYSVTEQPMELEKP